MIRLNPEEIGKKIREIRTKANMSQQKFAEKYGVTYQAVSKWETGKNIPDIVILKEICNDYGMNLDDFLNQKDSFPKKKEKLLKWGILIGIIILVLLTFLFLRPKDKPSFEFRTLSTTCDNFTISGSIAYDDKKSSIYIAKIDYCGKEEQEEYKEIECVLYETNKETKTEIGRYTYEGDKPIRLEQFLENVNFTINHYERSCRLYKENGIHLEISGSTNSGKTVTYQVPLTLEDDCNN